MLEFHSCASDLGNFFAALDNGFNILEEFPQNFYVPCYVVSAHDTLNFNLHQ